MYYLYILFFEICFEKKRKSDWASENFALQLIKLFIKIKYKTRWTWLSYVTY